MASTQAEAEAPRNGPEMKDLDGPNTNGVDAQMETNSSNGPTSTPISNNGSHDMNDSSKLQSSYYKPPVGYPGDGSPAAGYENAQSGFGYPPHSYIHQQQQQSELQQQGSYPYSQYPGSNLVRSVSSPVANKPGAYMNSMPRPVGGPVPSYPPVHHSGAPGGGQGYPPSRYPTPTLNQLLQPGTVQRYPYGDYPQQQQQQPPPPPNSHAGWPMQQTQQPPRNFAPGFKPPPNSMQQQQQVRVVVKLFTSSRNVAILLIRRGVIYDKKQ